MEVRTKAERKQLTVRAMAVCKINFRKDMNSKSTKFGMLLLLIYIAYLAVGAAIFMVLETPNEVQTCQQARHDVRAKVDKLGIDYFFMFGLNQMVCTGISAYFSNGRKASAAVTSLLMGWERTNCSRDGYLVLDLAMNKLSKSDSREYGTIWAECFQGGVTENYHEEQLSISRNDLARLLTSTARFSIGNYLTLNNECHGSMPRWDYHNAFFFAGSLASTIGYGNISPETRSGKLFCILFIMIGIPYFGYMLSIISEIIRYKFNNIFVIEYGDGETRKGTALFLYVVIGGIVIIIMPSFAFTQIEGWDYLDSVYYSLISLTTIGIGDYVPTIDPPAEYAIQKSIRNDTACFEALIDPIPSAPMDNETGLPEVCNPTEWPSLIQLVYSTYRIVVFLWILIGLVWLGGLIQMVTEKIRERTTERSEGNIPSAYPVSSGTISRPKPFQEQTSGPEC